MKKLFLILLTGIFFQTINTRAQVPYTANDQVNPYTGIFRPGINPGYYGGNWNDYLLTDIVGGNPAAGTEGAGVRTLRSSLPESIVLIFDYPTWEGIYDYYEAMGMKDNTLIVGFAHPDHQDPVQYCPGSQTDMFANLYEPIFDGGLNGTPVNENNYFARYMWDLLESVGDHVKFWEVWNEPGFDYSGAAGWLQPGQPGNWWDNNPNPCDYKLQAPIFHFVRTMRIAYQVIKTHSPDDYVVLSGVGYESFLDAVLRNTDNPNNGSVTSAYPLGGGAYFDVMGFHSYPHFDGSMRAWNNALGGFEYFRHSDRGIEGFLDKKAVREQNLANYGYDGNTYPKKEWMITEYNVPRVSFADPGNPNVNLFGSDEGARNFIMKSYVAAMQEGLIQIHPYQIAERETAANADDSFDHMGFFENLNVVEKFDQVIHEQGIGYKTTTEMLFGKEYDAARTAQMNLPSNVKGGAFKNLLGQFTYVLWARTSIDNSEVANANYSFPSSMGVGNLEKRLWNYGNTGTVTTTSSSNISLDGAPTFFTPTSNTSEGEITMNCPIDSISIEMSATLAEGGKTFSWTAPTATTTCPLGGLTITQISGKTSGSFFPIGGDVIAYEAKDACGNLVECGFRVGVASSGGGIGNATTGCHASRDGFNFLGNFGGHKYFISLEPMNYTEALAATEVQGGYIASINDAAENAYLSYWNNDQAFIGMNDVAQEGNVVWHDGTAVAYTNFDNCSWCESNTSNNDATEFLPWSGKWNWIPKTDVRKVLMEVPCAETLGCGCPSTNEPVCGADGNTYSNSCEAECAGVFNYIYGSCGGTTTQTYFQTCPSDITVDASDNNGTTVTWNPLTIFNDCPNGYTLAQTSGPSSGGFFPIGTTQISYSLITGNGCNTATGSCSFTVTVNPPNTGGCSAPATIAGFTTLGEFGNSKYYLSDEISRPTDAQAIAITHGGYLAAISSASENNFIQQNISEMVYIGLNDQNNEDNFEWFNGEAFGYNNIAPCNFCNENSADLDFVIMAPWDGKWSFSNFYNNRKYVMEIPCGTSIGAPDLILTNPTGFVTSTSVGDILEVNTDVKNIGNAITLNEFAIRIHLSTDMVLDASDTQLTAINVPFLVSPGIGVTINFSDFEIPNVSSGNYYILVTVDANQSIAESNENNNTLIHPIQIGSIGTGCPQDITGFTALGEYGNSKYYISNAISRPTDAQVTAEANGGYLAAITSQGENDFIQQNISEMVYIGLNDATTEGVHQWFNGEPFTFDNINPCGFCNENGADMDYLIMAPWNGEWSYSNFYNQRLYIMEVPCGGSQPSGISVNCPSNSSVTIPNGSTTTPIFFSLSGATTDCQQGGLIVAQIQGPTAGTSVSAGTYAIGFEITDNCNNTKTCNFNIVVTGGGGGGCPSSLTGFTSLGEFGGSAYFLSNDIEKPAAAESIAASNGGHLVTINSQAENNFIFNQINELVYIGINDEQSEGDLAWTSGAPVTYDNFDVCSFCNENSASLDYVVMHGWNGGWSWSSQWNSRKYVVEVPCATPFNSNPQSLIALTQTAHEKFMLETLIPNPAQDFIYAKIVSPFEKDIQIQIFDARGTLLKTENALLQEGINSIQLDINELPSGFYFVHIPQEYGKNTSMRFVKMRN